MESYYRSRSYGNNGQVMQIESYNYGAPPPPRAHDIRSYSVSYAQNHQVGPNNYNNNNYNNRDLKLKKGKNMNKAWSFADPEFQRKKRVASYKMYSVEGKVKGSFRKSFRWLKYKYTQVVYGWW